MSLGPKSSDWWLITRGENTQAQSRQTHTRGHVTMGADGRDTVISQGSLRMARSHRKLEETGRILPRAFRRSTVLLTR